MTYLVYGITDSSFSSAVQNRVVKCKKDTRKPDSNVYKRKQQAKFES